MNLSSGSNGSTLTYRDSYRTVVAKNLIVVSLGLIINYVNGTLIHTFRKHQIFYVNPRYILFIHLVVNDMIQLTATISLFVLSYAQYSVNMSLCCVLVTLTVFTTMNTPLNLAVMAAECYVAICLPLRHAEFCTVRRTYGAIGCVWAVSALSALTDVFLVVATQPAATLFHGTVHCTRDALFRHPVHLRKRDVSFAVYLVAVWLALLFSYVQIFLAARASRASARDTKKARNTVLLHGFQLLLCMLTYVAHLIRSALTLWFPRHSVNIVFASYIVVQIVPRLLSPVVYGLRDKTFRQHLRKYLLC